MREDTLYEMLEDFAKLSGEKLDDIITEGLAEEIEPEGLAEGYESFELDELESEDTVEDEFSLQNPWGDDVADYMDEVFDDVDVDPDAETDYYAED